MSEITLTGGTLIPSSNEAPSLSGSSGGGSCDHHHDHHSHSHSHRHQRGGSLEMQQQQHFVPTTPSMEDLINSSKEEIARALSTLIRFGRYEAMAPLLDELEDKKNGSSMVDQLQQLDEGGHSLYHWSAKRVDDIRFLHKLTDLAVKYHLTPAVLNITSQDNVGMRPLHWACTEGSIPHAALLLKHGADMEAKDCSGCTPLLIAAQYGQVEVVAYLLKKGANIQAVDSSMDTALHWAAYKGSIHVCGLLTYYQTLSFSTQDAYGQTPVHLAALRGHTSVVRYILQRLPKKDVLFVKDKNERTPLDLAIHKNRPTVEVVLREAMAAAEDPRGHFFRKTLWSNLKDVATIKTWKSWMGLTVGLDEMDEPTRAPYYFVLANYVLHFAFLVLLFAPVYNVGEGLLWDKAGWLLLNFVLMFLTWFFFYKTVKTSPGYLDESCPDIGKWRKLYEETLEAYADENSQGHLQLCHTCHVARPLRSKHCRVRRKCVLLYDHFCPFVDNSIGLYNYRYFYFFLFFLTWAVLCFGITLTMYLYRYRKEHGSTPWLILSLGLEVCLTLLPVGGMLIYHTQLSMVNLTTNEHINVRKYKYLYPIVNGKRQYRNPWFKGYVGNFMDRMFPSQACYELPSDHEALMAHSSSDAMP